MIDRLHSYVLWTLGVIAVAIVVALTTGFVTVAPAHADPKIIHVPHALEVQRLQEEIETLKLKRQLDELRGPKESAPAVPPKLPPAAPVPETQTTAPVPLKPLTLLPPKLPPNDRGLDVPMPVPPPGLFTPEMTAPEGEVPAVVPLVHWWATGVICQRDLQEDASPKQCRAVLFRDPKAGPEAAEAAFRTKDVCEAAVMRGLSMFARPFPKVEGADKQPPDFQDLLATDHAWASAGCLESVGKPTKPLVFLHFGPPAGRKGRDS